MRNDAVKYSVRLDTLYGLKKNKNEKDIILIDHPHPQSSASLILLKMQYMKRDSSRRVKSAKNEWRIWLNFRNRFMKKWKRDHGQLICFYCHKKDLYANINSPFAAGREATLDHYIPQSKGGKKYDESNLRICCSKCNQLKKDKMPEEFTL